MLSRGKEISRMALGWQWSDTWFWKVPRVSSTVECGEGEGDFRILHVAGALDSSVELKWKELSGQNSAMLEAEPIGFGDWLCEVVRGGLL